jgi:hypothetical protein
MGHGNSDGGMVGSHGLGWAGERVYGLLLIAFTVLLTEQF